VPRRSVPALQVFDPVTDSEIQSLLATMPYCLVDPIPTWLFKELALYMVPVIRHICSLSLQIGSFPTALKQALVQPRVKNPTLDLEQLKPYRPISKLPYLSKVVERVVGKRFISHANTFDLLSTHQSAYRQHHSTETAILSVHNDLVHAVDDGKVTFVIQKQ